MAHGWWRCSPRKERAAVAIAYSLVTLLIGLQVGSFGPSILDLASRTNSSVQLTAYAVSFRTIFSVGGAALQPLYDVTWVKPHWLLAVSCALMAIGQLLVPFVTNLPGLYGALALQGFAGGMTDGVNVLMLWLFDGDTSGAPWLQAMHFAFSFGATSAPLILGVTTTVSSEGQTIPLSGNSPGEQLTTLFVGMGVLATCLILLFLVLPSPISPKRRTAQLSQIDDVKGDRAALHLQASEVDTHAIGDNSGMATPPPAGPQPVVEVPKGAGMETQETADGKPDLGGPVHKKSRRCFNIFPLSADSFQVLRGACMLMLFVGAEHTFGNFITTFAMMLGGEGEAAAQLLASVYWASMTVGRFSSIFLSARFTPGRILLVATAGSAASAALLLFTMWTPPALIWVVAVLFGFCMAPIYPSTVSFIGGRVKLTARQTTIFSLGNTFGAWLLPFLVASSMGGLSASSRSLDASTAPFGFTFCFVILVASCCKLLLHITSLKKPPNPILA